MSAREAEVLDAVGAHLSNAQIAGRLHISVRTVESHVASLLRKLGAADRRELVGLAAVTQATAAPLGLPASWTTFIGRERERASVLAALRKARLVTLVACPVGPPRLQQQAVPLAGPLCVVPVGVDEGLADGHDLLPATVAIRGSRPVVATRCVTVAGSC